MATALAKTRHASPFSAGASSSPAAGWRRTATLEQVPKPAPNVGGVRVRISLLSTARATGARCVGLRSGPHTSGQVAYFVTVYCVLLFVVPDCFRACLLQRAFEDHRVGPCR
jgi:hypothetical protein